MSASPRPAPGAREWDAAAYHQVSAPMQGWGREVLARLEPAGDELALDAGCGSGHVTAQLAAMLPRGAVVGLDGSLAMLRQARQHLDAAVALVGGDLEALPFADASVDVVVSTATFHWVLDHDRLVAELHRVLRPGGRLLAQCGGEGNIEHVHALAEGALAEDAELARRVAGWRRPWHFAGADEMAARLRGAGFERVTTELVAAPVVIDDADELRRYLRTVILRTHLERLGDEALGDRLLDGVVDGLGREQPRRRLDYVRLNISARRTPRDAG